MEIPAPLPLNEVESEDFVTYTYEVLRSSQYHHAGRGNVLQVLQNIEWTTDRLREMLIRKANEENLLLGGITISRTDRGESDVTIVSASAKAVKNVLPEHEQQVADWLSSNRGRELKVLTRNSGDWRTLVEELGEE